MRKIKILLLVHIGILWATMTHIAFAADGKSDKKPLPSKAAEVTRVVENSFTTTTEDIQWLDTERSRQVPVKIFYPVVGKGPYPVIIFSHGLGRSRNDCAYLGNHWASQGYVAVFVEHLGSDESIWKGQLQRMKHLKQAYENPATMRNRPSDMSFVLNQLEQLKRDHDSLGNRLDLDRIGAAGFDLGAETVMVLAGQLLPGGLVAADHRVKAIVAMSPPVPLGQVQLDIAYKDIHIPCFYITGSEDDGIVGTTKAFQRRLPFDYAQGADQYLAIFQGGDHMIYAGHVRQRESEKDALFQPLIRDATTLFWDAYLKEKPQALASIHGSGLKAVLGRSASVEKKLIADTAAHAQISNEMTKQQ